MRRVLWLVIVVWFAAAACSINTQASGTGTSPDAGAPGAGGSGGTGSGTGGSTCFPKTSEKFCGSTCPPKTDPAHGCADPSCAACALPNAINDCTADGKCGIQSCNPGYSDCDGDAADGCEVDTNQDPHNCGTCGHDCFAGGGTTNWVCDQGKCAVSKCPLGKGDCNNNPADGCEDNLTSDPKNCSFCGHDCSNTVLHATAVCNNSKCDYSTCDPGWADCDGDRSNGCEQDITTDPTNCGKCGNTCASTNGAAGCVSGKCTISCKPGLADCDPAKPGCDTDITTTANCGACGNVCSNNNAKAACTNGKCVLTCNGTWKDCNHDASDGCEVDTSSNADNCGACGTVCNLANATQKCDKGSCVIGACNSGYKDCNGKVSDGCEVNLNTDVNHCGDCPVDCTTAVQNATPVCSSGSCSYSGNCNGGFGDCDGKKSNGCEASLTQLPNCGTCGNDCSSVQHVNTVVCSSSGTCDFSGGCKGPWGNCNTSRADGCETDFSQPATCGSCSNDCTQKVANVPLANITCGANGACGYTGACNAGWGDCDGNKANGCETDLTTAHNTNCGKCGTNCKGGPQHTCTCSAGTCSCP